MGRTNKNSRRQRIIGLDVGYTAHFPLTSRAAISSQLYEIRTSTGQRYEMETTEKLVKVKRIS